jgi:hypothetical protein
MAAFVQCGHIIEQAKHIAHILTQLWPQRILPYGRAVDFQKLQGTVDQRKRITDLV